MHLLLMFMGGILLVVGLVAPWYYLDEEEKHYSMSAMGGSLADELSPEFFSPLGAYISLSFAIISVVFPFFSVKLSEGGQRKYVAVLSCFTGICALMNILYIHYWLGVVFPDTPFICYGPNVSCGPTIGYFLTWAAMALLFASTYVSQGLSQKPVKVES